MKYLLTLVLLLYISIQAMADIRPDPIQAKGIINNDSTSSIRMESELVMVDLYKDSSFVTCTFNMKNYGDAKDLQIGFPEMNFYYLNFLHKNDKREINITETNNDGSKKTVVVSGIQTDSSSMVNRPLYHIGYKPWLVWNSSFKKNESKIITVNYALPCGQLKNGLRYFTYLLHTGADWKGTIGDAKVIVCLHNIDQQQLIKTEPDFCINGDTITWSFTDFEPNEANDIQIYYEPELGYWEKFSSKKSVTIVVNEKIIPEIETTDMETWNFEKFASSVQLKPEEIESIEVLQDPENIQKYGSESESVLKITTKDFAKNK